MLPRLVLIIMMTELEGLSDKTLSRVYMSNKSRILYAGSSVSASIYLLSFAEVCINNT